MQSQQKRVKWSRGETAEALEERTDTGITQASVELMENCIPDIYGNISRRPALSLFKNTLAGSTAGFVYDKYLQVIPYYITEDDIILVGVHYGLNYLEMIRLTNGEIIGYQKTNLGYAPSTQGADGKYHQVSFSQQNNYMLIADDQNVWKLQFDFTGGAWTPSLTLWRFIAGWYAPNGTQTKTVDTSSIADLKISGDFANYTYQYPDGSATVFTWTDTNVSFGRLSTMEQQIPVGSIIKLPNIGTSFRVEGYTLGDTDILGIQYRYLFDGTVFDDVLNINDTVPSTGIYARPEYTPEPAIAKYVNGGRVERIEVGLDTRCLIRCTRADPDGYFYGYFFNNGGYVWSGWYSTPATMMHIYMYGSLMVPVVDSSATDSRVTVEYGFINLTPENFNTQYSYPHPTELLFLDQRLWTGNWKTTATESYALVIGSQIARYSDLKNDYNQENEPITLDMLTQFKENIVHLIDYNGLKIMTNSFEYAYENGAVVKQSANGSLENCNPLVFDSLCLYVDSTGQQIKAMQYEFQSNIFNSSTINQLATHNLIWNPVFLASYEDKLNSSGKYLFVVNSDGVEAPRLAVCNFVPTNQANIWNRWSFKDGIEITQSVSDNMLHSVIQTKKEPIFMVVFGNPVSAESSVFQYSIYPAHIDFEANADIEGAVYTYNNRTYYSPFKNWNSMRLSMPNTDVAVYANGEFQWIDKTTVIGSLTKDITGLTNVTVGMPINATVRSHPIDVGGKTKSIKKRIGKSIMSVHDTASGAITINGKTGYMNPRGDKISFYGVTGMKDEIRYTLTNKNGAMFHLESLLMNIEYGTLDS